MTAVGTKVFASEYNAIQAAISTVLGTSAGASGYGQTVLSSQVSTSSSITVTQWANLRADLLKAYLHQGTPGDLPLPSVPQKSTLPYTIVTYSDYNRYLDLSNVITANAGVAPPAGQATLQTFSTGSYTSSWNGQLTHSVVLTFANANQARYYFNTGGNIQFSASLINYPGYPAYGAQSASYAKNSDWNMLLNNMGTTTFGRNSTVNSGNGTGQTILSAVGYFQLTTGEQNIYRKTTSSASYTPNQYDLYANVDATGAVITFNIRFKDLSTTSGTGFGATDENVEGSLTSLIQGYYASGSYVAATPPATTATFAGGAVVSPPPPPPPPPIYEPPPPPPVVVYNEVVSAPASVQVTGSNTGQTAPFSVSISGGSSGTSYSYTISGGAGGLFGGSGVLNASGAATLSLTLPNQAASYIYTFVFSISGNTRTVNVAAVAAPPAPSYGAFTASPNPAVNGQTITMTATAYNVPAGDSWYMNVASGGTFAIQALNIPFTGTGTQTVSRTFTFQQASAPYVSYFSIQSLVGTEVVGPVITLYTPPVVTQPSYGAYGWSPAGPVVSGTSITFSGTAVDAIGFIVGINVDNGGTVGSTTTSVVTTNPQTFSRTVTATYSAFLTYGVFLINGVTPSVLSYITVDAPAAPPPPAPTYTVSPGYLMVDEGGTISISITTTNVDNGTYLYWQLVPTITGLTPVPGSGDFSSAMSGSVQITSGAGSINLGVAADSLTEGAEYISVRVYSDSGLSNQVGYVSVGIYDTSTTPVVYDETVTGPSTVTVGNANFNVVLGGGAPNTGFSWTGATSGSGTLDASGNSSVPFASGSTIQSPLGANSFTVTFAATGHVRTYTVTVLAAPPPPPPPYVPPPPPYVPPPPPYVPPPPSMASYTASPNPASNGATITVTATVNNVTAGADWALQAIASSGSVIALNAGGTHASSGTQTVSATFTFNSSQAPYQTFYGQYAPVSYQYTGPIVTVAPLNPRVSTYLFYPTPTYVGQYVLFLVDVVDADGLGWGANVYTNNFYAIGSASGTISGNQLQAIIIGGFYTTTGMNLGTFYLSGVGVVQTQVNL